jgi:hypothetical protein
MPRELAFENPVMLICLHLFPSIDDQLTGRLPSEPGSPILLLTALMSGGGLADILICSTPAIGHSPHPPRSEAIFSHAAIGCG